MGKNKEMTLYDLAVDFVGRNDVDKEEVVALLNRCREGVRKDDPVYGFMIQLECVEESISLANRNRSAQDEVILLRVRDELARHRRELDEITTRALVSQRQQFRRLVAMRREKQFVRMLFMVFAFLLAFFSGTGIFYVYALFGKGVFRAAGESAKIERRAE